METSIQIIKGAVQAQFNKLSGQNYTGETFKKRNAMRSASDRNDAAVLNSNLNVYCNFWWHTKLGHHNSLFLHSYPLLVFGLVHQCFDIHMHACVTTSWTTYLYILPHTTSIYYLYYDLTLRTLFSRLTLVYMSYKCISVKVGIDPHCRGNQYYAKTPLA